MFDCEEGCGGYVEGLGGGEVVVVWRHDDVCTLRWRLAMCYLMGMLLGRHIGRVPGCVAGPWRWLSCSAFCDNRAVEMGHTNQRLEGNVEVMGWMWSSDVVYVAVKGRA